MSQALREIPFDQEKTSTLIPWAVGMMLFLILATTLVFYSIIDGATGNQPVPHPLASHCLALVALLVMTTLILFLLIFQASLSTHEKIIDGLLWMGASDQFIYHLFRKQTRLLIIKGTGIAYGLLAFTLYLFHVTGVFSLQTAMERWVFYMIPLILMPGVLFILVYWVGRTLIRSAIMDRF